MDAEQRITMSLSRILYPPLSLTMLLWQTQRRRRLEPSKEGYTGSEVVPSFERVSWQRSKRIAIGTRDRSRANGQKTRGPIPTYLNIWMATMAPTIRQYRGRNSPRRTPRGLLGWSHCRLYTTTCSLPIKAIGCGWLALLRGPHSQLARCRCRLLRSRGSKDTKR